MEDGEADRKKDEVDYQVRGRMMTISFSDTTTREVNELE